MHAPHGFIFAGNRPLLSHRARQVVQALNKRRLVTVICLALLSFAMQVTHDADGVVSGDLARRSPDVHWPTEPSPGDSDTFAHNEIDIHAPCAAAWQVLVDGRLWPQWYANSSDVKLHDGAAALERGTRFGWTTFHVHVESTVSEFETGHRLAWFGRRPGIVAYHTWLLQDVGAGCHVVTEEASKGHAAAAGRASNPGALHSAHDLWLAGLKKLAEARRADGSSE